MGFVVRFSNVQKDVAKFFPFFDPSSLFDNFFQVGFLYTNITTIKTQLTTIRETLSSIGPDMEIVHADMNGFKNDVDSLTAQLSVMGDPAR